MRTAEFPGIDYGEIANAAAIGSFVVLVATVVVCGVAAAEEWFQGRWEDQDRVQPIPNSSDSPSSI